MKSGSENSVHPANKFDYPCNFWYFLTMSKILFSTKLLNLITYFCVQSLLVPDSEATVLVKKEGGGVEVAVENNCLLVAIDSGVSRRPPKMKMEHDRRVYSKMIELLLNDEEIAANLLREISFGYLGPPFENEPTTQINDSEKLDHSKITKAFQKGVVAGIHDMEILRLFFVKLFRTLDHLLRDFMVYMSKQGEAQGENITEIGRNSASPQPHPGVTPDKKPELSSGFLPQDVPATLHFESLNMSDQKLANSGGELQEQPLGMPNLSTNFCTPSRVGPPKGSPRLTSLKISPKSMRRSPGSSPRLMSPNKISPTRDHWHEKGSPGRLTFKLKDVSKTAKVRPSKNHSIEANFVQTLPTLSEGSCAIHFPPSPLSYLIFLKLHRLMAR